MKMNRWPQRSILWALFVLGALLFLLSLCMPPARMMKVAKRNRTMAMAKDIQLGIKNFQVEYNKQPLPNGTTEDFTADSSGPLVGCLLGQKVLGNLREIVFLEAPLARDGRSGLVDSPDTANTTADHSTRAPVPARHPGIAIDGLQQRWLVG
jgi:hypothetical protein